MKNIAGVPTMRDLSFMSAEHDVIERPISRKEHHETTYGILQTE